MIEELEEVRGQSRWVWVHTIHASHLAPFDEPYVEPQKFTLEDTEEMPKPVQVPVWCSKRQQIGGLSCQCCFGWAGLVRCLC